MDTRHFCTIANRQYLSRALALYGSLARHAGPFRLFLLAIDEDTVTATATFDLENLHVTAATALEEFDRDLRGTRPARSEGEYCQTCKAAFMSYIFTTFQDVSALIFVDADTYFFADPQPLFDELGKASILITKQHLPQDHPSLEKFGTFNSGVVGFRRTADGLACLRRWREQCIKWCYDRHEPGLWTDQKYLDQWPGSFGGVTICRHRGVNVAHWNVAGKDVKSHSGVLTVYGVPLLCYHFAKVQLWSPIFMTARPHLKGPRSSRRVMLSKIYLPYMRELRVWTIRLVRLGLCRPAGLSIRSFTAFDPEC